MSPEMTVLAVVTLFYLFSWLPPLIAQSQTYRIPWLAGNRGDEDQPPLLPAAERALRAHDNLRESYPPFAIAVLLLAFTGGFTQYTAWASLAFLAARLVHMPAAILGASWLRSFSWLVGLAATLYLLIMALVALL
ncbi:MAG TPA: MAPEG family protein [Gammaproteobacteria bacterium]|nr:MAPEG family protein [Gammaproteobacteria bacterium]